ncbi:DUF7344 domain-containing protein [Natrinema versiforme]|uniref:DUF7344 domain-containing protein n=1 Tax=Natrinema versiforme JCM 10478 TaxID=1227496 RepID=L9XVA3_9EURY|nr:hypothetical protein [Natrinema versiforme]ELY65695.1 hypothetical protein C489_14035 [Natrinema versiforme JCM 10478]
MTDSTAKQRASIPSDSVLSAVASEHRRAVLRSLDRSDENAIAVSALTELVAKALRNGAVPDDERRRIRTALHHIHLPKLEDFGLLSYDIETGQVRAATGGLDADLRALIMPHDIRE